MTVLEACVRRRGVHRGAITAAHVAQWALTTAELGRLPLTREYAEWWAISERTGERHRAGIHDVFGDRWPEVVEAVAFESKRRRLRAPRDVLQLAVA